MNRLMAVVTVLTAGWACGLAPAQNINDVKALRTEEKGEKDARIVRYRFTADGRHVTAAEQAAIRGEEAAEAFAAFDKSQPIALVARSPYGGAGQQGGGYWPPGVKADLLRKLVEPLEKQGLTIETPELPDLEDEGDDAKDAEEADPGDFEFPKVEKAPYPKTGFSPDFEFVLVVGLHHEDIPYKGLRRQADGRPVYDRSSRVNAWAVLFHAPTGNGFWGATASAKVNHRNADAPLNDAVQSVLAYLNVKDIGTHNIPDLIKKFQAAEELPAVDLATLLVQSQRADGVAAVVAASMKPPAFKNTAWVLRYFNDKGTPQDFRQDPDAAQRKQTNVSQPLMLRILYMEQLLGATGVQAAAAVAVVPEPLDMQIHPIGAALAGRLPPMCPDDEIVLLSELAAVDVYNKETSLYYKNASAAVKSLGGCRTWIDEAIVAAKVYANRPDPPPVQGKARTDPIKQAAQQAIGELSKAKEDQRRKEQAELRKAAESAD